MRPEAILNALQRAHPDTVFCELTGTLLYEQEERDRRKYCGPSLAERLEELFTAIELAQGGGHRRAGVHKLLLSKTEACRLLGIDPKTTLARLIADKHIRVVKAPHGERIPRSEVERLAQEGIPPADAVPRARPPRAPPPPGVGARIRALKVP